MFLNACFGLELKLNKILVVISHPYARRTPSVRPGHILSSTLNQIRNVVNRIRARCSPRILKTHFKLHYVFGTPRCYEPVIKRFINKYFVHVLSYFSLRTVFVQLELRNRLNCSRSHTVHCTVKFYMFTLQVYGAFFFCLKGVLTYRPHPNWFPCPIIDIRVDCHIFSESHII